MKERVNLVCCAHNFLEGGRKTSRNFRSSDLQCMYPVPLSLAVIKKNLRDVCVCVCVCVCVQCVQ